jgi:hypothetical protein
VKGGQSPRCTGARRCAGAARPRCPAACAASSVAEAAPCPRARGAAPRAPRGACRPLLPTALLLPLQGGVLALERRACRAFSACRALVLAAGAGAGGSGGAPGSKEGFDRRPRPRAPSGGRPSPPPSRDPLAASGLQGSPKGTGAAGGAGVDDPAAWGRGAPEGRAPGGAGVLNWTKAPPPNPYPSHHPSQPLQPLPPAMLCSTARAAPGVANAGARAGELPGPRGWVPGCLGRPGPLAPRGATPAGHGAGRPRQRGDAGRPDLACCRGRRGAGAARAAPGARAGRAAGAAPRCARCPGRGGRRAARRSQRPWQGGAT